MTNSARDPIRASRDASRLFPSRFLTAKPPAALTLFVRRLGESMRDFQARVGVAKRLLDKDETLT
jgi:hypothetical protein